MVPSLRREVAALDPLLPLANVKSLASLVDASIAGRRFTMVLFLAFAVVAATLSVIGVYSVLAYLVSQRTKEIGLRLAIGASPSGVLWLVVREGMLLTTVADPATFAGVACALTVAAVLATYIPARRASSVDPTDALRTD
jgi:ABC-type antimicrobial peptide transport system permease subunit